MIEETICKLLEPICPQTYPVVAPKSTKAPFIIYTRVSTPRLRDFDGLTGMAWPTFRVDVYAPDFDKAREMATAVRRALDGYRDADVSEIALMNEQDMSDLVSTPGLTRVMLEFRITHTE